MIRNQRPNSNDCDRNVYLAFLPIKQRQGIIHVMLGYVLEHMRKKRRNKIAHIRFCGIRLQEVIGINNFAKEAGINNPEIAR